MEMTHASSGAQRTFGIVRMIPVADILFNEQDGSRDDYGDVKELQTSIARVGLINPITVHTATGNAPYQLIAGRRRFLALQGLKHQNVSCRIYTREVNDYDLKAIELYENIHRKDLSEVEKARMTKEMHELLQSINGPKVSNAVGAVGHSLRDTAKMLNRSVGSVSQDIKLAKAAEDFPELQLHKISSKATAMKMVMRLSSAVQNRSLAANAAIEIDPNNPIGQLIGSYRVGNFFHQDLELGTYSFIECDPPYAIDIHTRRAAADKLEMHAQYNEIQAEDYAAFLQRLATRTFELANDNAWIVLWYGAQWYTHCVLALRSAGWWVNDVPAIWKKGNSPGQSSSPDSALGNAYESFIYAKKGSPKVRIMGRSNIFDYSIPHALHRIHPTERPRELIVDILNTFSWAGANVLCPFAGSGNTILAANSLKMSCTGFDLSEHYRNAFVARVLGQQMGGK